MEGSKLLPLVVTPWTSPLTQRPCAQGHRALPLAGKVSLAPGTCASHHLSAKSMDPCQVASSFPHLASVGMYMSLPYSADGCQGGRQGSGTGPGGHCLPCKAGRLPLLPACELAPDTGSSYFSGEKGLGLFCPGTVPVGKGSIGTGHMCTHHHVQHVTRRQGHTQARPHKRFGAPMAVRPQEGRG